MESTRAFVFHGASGQIPEAAVEDERGVPETEPCPSGKEAVES